MNYLTLVALVGTSLLGSVAGVLGSFAVLRRRALVGDLLSHAALPGLCLAFLILGQRLFLGMLAGALVTGLAGVALITLACRWTRTKEDAALGIILSTFFGGGIVLSSIIQNHPGTEPAGLQSYIYGQVVGMSRQDLYLLASVSAVVLVIVFLLYKEFLLLSFDPGFAKAQGWPTLGLDMTMMGTFALVTVAGLPAVGVVLMAALLILPGATARFWTDRLGPLLLISAVVGAATGAGGTLLSAGLFRDWFGFDPFGMGEGQSPPTGPVIVLSGTAVFLFSVLFAPRRGVVANLWANVQLRRRTARENLLRTLYELSEAQLPELPAISLDRLLKHRAWSSRRARRLASGLVRSQLAEWTAGAVRLSAAGLAEAEKLVRAHRLWELFLIQDAHIAPDHVHRDADAIEHLLSPKILAHLEAELAGAGSRSAAALPPSPHETAPTADVAIPDANDQSHA